MGFIERKILSNKQEKLINSLYRRKKRYELGLCLCEGLRACKEICKTKPELIQLALASESFDTSDFPDIDFYFIPQNKFRQLSATVNSQGILFVLKIPDFGGFKNKKRDYCILLDGIADPGNFGTILRTASAVGLNEVWYSKGSVDPFSEKTIRSALGAQFRLDLIEYKDIKSAIKDLNKLGIEKIYRTEPSKGESCFEAETLFEKSAIIFGNEARGLNEIEGTIPLNIPMPGKFESLNLAQAVTVILFESVRRQEIKIN